MAFRTVCICDDKQIGIESIYTFVDGKQINIPGKVENLRKLGRERKLFCPCGCGNNLILVAGDKNLREQHFRILSTEGAKECTANDEGLLSIQSKIILDYWFRSKLSSEQIEGRVSLDRIYETERKFEYTFYDFKNQVGLCYWHNRGNIESEKIDTISELSKNSHNIYIADIENVGTNGQYPEFLIKIQEKQQYVLYLNINDSEEYNDATLVCNVLVHNNRGEWVELSIITDKLDAYDIQSSGIVTYRGTPLDVLSKAVISAFEERERKIADERKARHEAYLREEQLRKENEEKQKQIRQQKLKELAEEKEKSEKERRELQKLEDARYQKEIESIKNSEQIKQRFVAIDSKGKKWYRCKYCEKVARPQEMLQYGVRGNLNLSVCRECEDIHKEETRKKFL